MDDPHHSVHISGEARDIYQVSAKGDVQFNISSSEPASLSSGRDIAPDITDLFDIIHDPNKVGLTIFRADEPTAYKPQDFPYLDTGRIQTSSAVDTLRQELASNGKLLITGRSGLGKTRCISELAQKLCNDGNWTICVAKGTGDTRIDALSSFPDKLRGSGQILFIIDDLHQRVDARDIYGTPYLDRLTSFLGYMDIQTAPSGVYVIAATRSVQYQEKPELDPKNPLLQRFSVYDLPEFEDQALVGLLHNFAKWARVQVDEEDLATLVDSSDRTPETLALNVDWAKRSEAVLSKVTWKQSKGESWEVRFMEVNRRSPNASDVLRAMYLLKQGKIPTRTTYVRELGLQISEVVDTDVSGMMTTIESLINNGVIRQSDDLLDVFEDEQLENLILKYG